MTRRERDIAGILPGITPITDPVKAADALVAAQMIQSPYMKLIEDPVKLRFLEATSTPWDAWVTKTPPPHVYDPLEPGPRTMRHMPEGKAPGLGARTLPGDTWTGIKMGVRGVVGGLFGTSAMMTGRGLQQYQALTEASAREMISVPEFTSIFREGFWDDLGNRFREGLHWAAGQAGALVPIVSSIAAGAKVGAWTGAKAGALLGPKGAGIGAIVGSVVGSFKAGYVLYAGGIYGDLRTAGASHEDAKRAAIKYGAPASAVSIVLPAAAYMSISGMLGKTFTRNYVKKMVQGAVVGATFEGLAEGVAEACVIAGEESVLGIQMTPLQKRNRIVNAAFAGGLMGIGTGGTGMGLQKRGDIQTITDAMFAEAEKRGPNPVVAELLIRHLEAAQDKTPGQVQVLKFLKELHADKSRPINKELKKVQQMAVEAVQRSDEASRSRMGDLLKKFQDQTITGDEALELTVVLANRHLTVGKDGTIVLNDFVGPDAQQEAQQAAANVEFAETARQHMRDMERPQVAGLLEDPGFDAPTTGEDAARAMHERLQALSNLAEMADNASLLEAYTTWFRSEPGQGMENPHAMLGYMLYSRLQDRGLSPPPPMADHYGARYVHVFEEAYATEVFDQLPGSGPEVAPTVFVPPGGFQEGPPGAPGERVGPEAPAARPAAETAPGPFPATQGARARHNGDVIEFTGQTKKMFGKDFLEFVRLDGDKKGTTGWVAEGEQFARPATQEVGREGREAVPGVEQGQQERRDIPRSAEEVAQAALEAIEDPVFAGAHWQVTKAALRTVEGTPQDHPGRFAAMAGDALDGRGVVLVYFDMQKFDMGDRYVRFDGFYNPMFKAVFINRSGNYDAGLAHEVFHVLADIAPEAATKIALLVEKQIKSKKGGIKSQWPAFLRLMEDAGYTKEQALLEASGDLVAATLLGRDIDAEGVVFRPNAEVASILLQELGIGAQTEAMAQTQQEAQTLQERTEAARGEWEVLEADPSGVPEAQRWEAAVPQDGRIVWGVWEVVDVDTIITSDRPGYRKELQERTTRGKSIKSKQQIDSFQKKIRVVELGESGNTKDGAPIVLPNNEAVNNGRVMGIRAAYRAKTESSEVYRKFVQAEAKKRGLSAEGIKNPILTRRVMDTAGMDVQKFAEFTNRDPGLSVEAIEMAQSDAQNILAADILKFFEPSDTGKIDTPNNREFLERFVKEVGDPSLRNEMGGFTDKITPRVKNAMLFVAIGGTERGNAVASVLLSSAKNLDIVGIVDGIIDAAPNIAEVAAKRPSRDITPHLSQAMGALIGYKNDLAAGKVKNLADWMALRDIFSGDRSAEVDALLVWLDKAKTAKQVRSVLQGYSKQALKRMAAESGASLFGEKPPTNTELIREAIKNESERVKKERAERAERAEEAKPKPEAKPDRAQDRTRQRPKDYNLLSAGLHKKAESIERLMKIPRIVKHKRWMLQALKSMRTTDQSHPSPTAAALAGAAESRGLDIVYVNVPNRTGAHQYAGRLYEKAGVFFINRADDILTEPGAVEATIAHEVYHSLEKQDPAFHQKMVDALKAEYGDKQQFDRLLGFLKESGYKARTEVWSEAAADAFSAAVVGLDVIRGRFVFRPLDSIEAIIQGRFPEVLVEKMADTKAPDRAEQVGIGDDIYKPDLGAGEIQFRKRVEVKNPAMQEILDRAADQREDFTRRMREPRRMLDIALDKVYSDLYTSRVVVRKTVGDVPHALDPAKLMQQFRGWSGVAQLFIKKHVSRFDDTTKKVGEALADIVHDPKYKIAQNYEVFNAFLVARRIKSLYENAETRKHFFTEGGQERPDAIREYELAKQIYDDYSQKRPEWLEAAERLTAYNNSLLDYLVSAGMLARDQVENIKRLHPDYIPLEVLDLIGPDGKTSGQNIRRAVKKLGKIKGGQAYERPIDSMVSRTFTIVRVAHDNWIRAKWANLIKKYGEAPHDGEPALGWFEKPKALPVFKRAKYLVEAARKARGKDTAREVRRQLINEYGDILGKEEIDIIMDMVGLSHDGADAVAKLWTQSAFQEFGMLSFVWHGETHWIRVNSDVYQAITKMPGAQAENILRHIAFITKWMRVGAVWSPDFIAFNPIRDLFQVIVQAKHFVNWRRGPIHGMGDLMMAVSGVRTFQGFMSVVKQDKHWQGWILEKGGMAHLAARDMRGAEKLMGEMLREKKHGKFKYMLFKHPLFALQTLSGNVEAASRVAVYRKAHNELMWTGKYTEAEARQMAAFESRESSLDYSDMGTMIAPLNMLTAFLNANLRGYSQVMKTFANKDTRANATINAFLAIMMPSLILWAINRDKDWFKEQPRWLKNSSWIWSFDGGKTINVVPKPFELGLVWGSLPERFMEQWSERDPKAVSEWVDYMVRSVPSNVLPMLLGVVEGYADFNFWRGERIVGERLGRVPRELQYTAHTSELAKLIGKGMSVSPMHVENWINTSFAGIGRYATQLVDIALHGVRGELQVAPWEKNFLQSINKPERQGRVDDIPALKRFFRSQPKASTRYTGDFYDYLERAEHAAQAYNNMITGKATKRELLWLLRGEMFWLSVQPVLSESALAISQLTNSIRLIENPDMDATPARRRELLNQHYTARNVYMRRVVEQIEELRRDEKRWKEMSRRATEMVREALEGR